jgi:aldose 1-epimerase
MTSVILNAGRTTVELLSIGATIHKLYTPDREGNISDIVLGCDDIDLYSRGETPYFGCIVGRVANRIKNGTFTLDGVTYHLACNNGPNCLHGGILGFHRAAWEIKRQERRSVTFEYVSEDGEEGFPGRVHIRARYELEEDGSSLLLDIEGHVNGDKATPLNLAGHAYFNLGGHSSGDCLGHELELVDVKCFTPLDENQIPTGEILPVEVEPAMDFRSPKTIGFEIDKTPGKCGYDHNFVLHGMGTDAADKVNKGMARQNPGLAAILYDPSCGRGLKVLTTAPGLQLYTANYLDGTLEGKSGYKYEKYGGICLETQGFPDAVNQPHFPSTVFQPGDVYRHVIRYEFFTK